MSYILDALKKAEQERDLGRVPRLETVHDNAPHRTRVLPWLIVGILLINVAALIWWLRPGAHSDLATPVRQAPLPEAAPPRAVQVAPASPVTPPITHVPAPVMVAPPVAAPPVTPAPPQMPAAPTPVADAPAVASVPLLRDLPPDLRAAVPPMSLDVHVYAPTATDRFVLINMKKYHENEQLAEGPRIEEITEEGVVLSYQGQMFRIARP